MACGAVPLLAIAVVTQSCGRPGVDRRLHPVPCVLGAFLSNAVVGLGPLGLRAALAARRRRRDGDARGPGGRGRGLLDPAGGAARRGGGRRHGAHHRRARAPRGLRGARRPPRRGRGRSGTRPAAPVTDRATGGSRAPPGVCGTRRRGQITGIPRRRVDGRIPSRRSRRNQEPKVDQSSRYADLALGEAELIAGGRHVLCAYRMKPKDGYDYLATAAHFAAESSDGHQRRGLDDGRLHALGGRHCLRGRRGGRAHEDRLPSGALRPQHHRRQGDDRLVPHAHHRQQPGHGRRRVRQAARLLRAARLPGAVRRAGEEHQGLLACPRPPARGRRHDRRHHHQAQARPAARALRRTPATSSGWAATSSRTTSPRATRSSRRTGRPCAWWPTPCGAHRTRPARPSSSPPTSPPTTPPR